MILTWLHVLTSCTCEIETGRVTVSVTPQWWNILCYRPAFSTLPRALPSTFQVWPVRDMVRNHVLMASPTQHGLLCWRWSCLLKRFITSWFVALHCISKKREGLYSHQRMPWKRREIAAEVLNQLRQAAICLDRLKTHVLWPKLGHCAHSGTENRWRWICLILLRQCSTPTMVR